MNTRALRRIGLVAGVATTSAIVLAGCAVTTVWLTILGALGTGLLMGAEWATRWLPG